MINQNWLEKKMNELGFGMWSDGRMKQLVDEINKEIAKVKK